MKIILSYRAAPRIRTWETASMAADAFRFLGHEVHEYCKLYESDEWPHKADLSEHYNLSLFFECNDPSPQYLEMRLVNADCRVGCFYDTSYYPQQQLSLIEHLNLDYTFFANPHYVGRMPRTHWLPYAAGIQHIRNPAGAKLYDVALVGSPRKERKAIIKKLQKAGIDAHLISGVFKEDYVHALASARIVVNENPPAGRGLLNMRCAEAPAAGALLLNNSGDYTERMFEVGKHCFVYEDLDSLVEMCRTLLKDDAWKTYALAGHDHIITKHTYIQRAKEILEVIHAN